MKYSQTQLANMAISRVGGRSQITSITDGSPNALKVQVVWDAVFQEVLTERDWKFAKTRATLEQSPTTPLYGYDFAYALPGDFLRFVRPHKRPRNVWDYYWGSGPEGQGFYLKSDPPFAPPGFPYVIETLPDDGNLYLLTDYDCSYGYNPMINYIRIISDYTKIMPGFATCFVYRLAAEISIPITEDEKKYGTMMTMYKDTLNSAMAQNECYDFLENETGSRSWERAGRW